MTSDELEARAHDFHLPTHKLNYLVWGKPGNSRIVLIHGGLDNAQTWEDLAVILARDWQVFALDLRGHGDSDWSSTGDYLSASYLADIAKFLKETVGWPARVVAHSMGARLMLQLMGSMPETVSSLVAIEGLGAARPQADRAIDEGMRKWITDRLGRGARGQVEQMGDWLRGRIALSRHLTPHTDLGSKIARQTADRKKGLTMRQAESFVLNNMRRAEDGFVWKFDPLARWQASNEIVESQLPFWTAILGRVLHIYGRDSWAYPPAAAKLAAFRDARIAVVPGAGHWLHLNKPIEVAAEIEKFFSHDISI